MIYIAVMAEYCHSCIWEYDGLKCGRELEYDDLQLPRELRDRILAWNIWLSREGAFGDSKFESEGLQIAVALKKHLGGGREVFYIGTADTPTFEITLIVHEDGSTTRYHRPPWRE